MPTVTISAAVDKMMKNMFAETMESCVAKLSEKYGFDEKEALEFLQIDGLKEKKAEKKEKKEKKEVDPNKPKKTSGYLLYSADVREQVKAKLIEDGGEGKPKEVVQAIAAKWKALKDEEKAVWNDKVKAAKEPVDAN
jgi:DNA-binding FrmR family transcriptional regulator